MTEETQNLEVQTPETQVEQPAAGESKQLSTIEQEALKLGWRPREEFDGDDDAFIDAKEFVRRQPLFEKIDHQSKELKDVKRALNALKDHYGKVQETEYNRALRDLRAQMKQANREGDYDRADAIENQIDRVEAEAAVLRQERDAIAVDEQPQVDPRFVAWTNKNPWYTSQKHMRAYADEVGVKLIAQGLTPHEVLAEVEKAVRKEFPNKFVNPNKANAPAVEGNSNRGGTKTQKADGFELTAQETKVMNDLVRAGVLTKEKYIADLKAVKGIK